MNYSDSPTADPLRDDSNPDQLAPAIDEFDPIACLTVERSKQYGLSVGDSLLLLGISGDLREWERDCIHRHPTQRWRLLRLEGSAQIREFDSVVDCERTHLKAPQVREMRPETQILTEIVGISTANGTNRIAIFAANLSAIAGFQKGKAVPWKRVAPLVVPIVVGAAFGAWWPP